MIPFGNHVVTMLHHNGTSYVREVISGCSWRCVNDRSLSDGATIITERTTCRIPPQYTRPVSGDLLILGDVIASAKNEIELVRLMESLRQRGYRAFRVQSCADNSHNGTPLAHYAATGE